MRIPLASVIVLLATHPAIAQHPDAKTIIQHSVAANQRDWDAEPHYDYTERTRNKDGGTSTFDVVMIDGSPYNRLSALNDQPLPPDREKEEQRKQDEELARRQSESPEARAARIGKYQAGRKRDHLMLSQLSAGMQFSFLREARIGQYRCWVLRATPRPGYQPPNSQARVLTGMRGKMWIDEDSYQWVKVEATVVHPVDIEGVLARVEPGTRFELEKRPVGDGLWFMTHFSMSARARVVFLFSYHSDEEDWYSDYRQSNSPSTGSRIEPRRRPAYAERF